MSELVFYNPNGIDLSPLPSAIDSYDEPYGQGLRLHNISASSTNDVMTELTRLQFEPDSQSFLSAVSDSFIGMGGGLELYPNGENALALYAARQNMLAAVGSFPAVDPDLGLQSAFNNNGAVPSYMSRSSGGSSTNSMGGLEQWSPGLGAAGLEQQLALWQQQGVGYYEAASGLDVRDQMLMSAEQALRNAQQLSQLSIGATVPYGVGFTMAHSGGFPGMTMPAVSGFPGPANTTPFPYRNRPAAHL